MMPLIGSPTINTTSSCLLKFTQKIISSYVTNRDMATGATYQSQESHNSIEIEDLAHFAVAEQNKKEVLLMPLHSSYALLWLLQNVR